MFPKWLKIVSPLLVFGVIAGLFIVAFKLAESGSALEGIIGAIGFLLLLLLGLPTLLGCGILWEILNKEPTFRIYVNKGTKAELPDILESIKETCKKEWEYHAGKIIDNLEIKISGKYLLRRCCGKRMMKAEVFSFIEECKCGCSNHLTKLEEKAICLSCGSHGVTYRNAWDAGFLLASGY